MIHLPLSNSSDYTIIDDEDWPLAYGVTWNVKKPGYVQGRRNGRMVLLHRLVMDAKEGQEVDHINRIKTDNRRENLRFCTRSENMYNTDKSAAYPINMTCKHCTEPFQIKRSNQRRKVYCSHACYHRSRRKPG